MTPSEVFKRFMRGESIEDIAYVMTNGGPMPADLDSVCDKLRKGINSRDKRKVTSGNRESHNQAQLLR